MYLLFLVCFLYALFTGVRTTLQTALYSRPADSSDFNAVNEQLEFGEGETEMTVEIQINDDTVSEPYEESFFVELYGPVNGALLRDPNTVEVFIEDDDGNDIFLFFFFLMIADIYT